METHFCSVILAYAPPMQCQQPHQARGTQSAKTHEGARTTSAVLALQSSPSLWGSLERTEGVPTPPLHQKLCMKPPRPWQHCQAALRRLLATLPVIGCDWAPDLNRTHPQGVHRDSLGSLKLVAELKVGDTPVLRTFFERTASIIVLYVI